MISLVGWQKLVKSRSWGCLLRSGDRKPPDTPKTGILQAGDRKPTVCLTVDMTVTLSQMLQIYHAASGYEAVLVALAPAFRRSSSFRSEFMRPEQAEAVLMHILLPVRDDRQATPRATVAPLERAVVSRMCEPCPDLSSMLRDLQ